jgi:5S rRNA maturation endonuclease (ribonuclease M5)
MRRKIPNLAAKMTEIITEFGFDADVRRSRTIYTTCPKCKKDDKFSILKENGSCICYRGSCNFKGWFTDWVMEMGSLTREQAQDKIYGPKNIDVEEGVKLDFLEDDDGVVVSDINSENTPIEWPLDHAVEIDSEQGKEGLQYLNSRGIGLNIAKECGIMYSPQWRRIIFKVTDGQHVYGYQARAIDNVEKHLRMRNNSGPWRQNMFVFQEKLERASHVIITEGPFDAMKFHWCTGSVAACGKVISEKQLKVITDNERIKEIYLALDPDAMPEMRALAKKVSLPVFVIKVPESTKQRCEAEGKKADFGECTMMEIAVAFEEAEEINNTLMVFLK